MVYYGVEIGNKKTGRGYSRAKKRTFDTRGEADSYARTQIKRGNPVTIDKVTGYLQRTVFQKGFKNKGNKDYKGNQYFGKLRSSRRNDNPFGNMDYGMDFNFLGKPSRRKKNIFGW